MNSGDTILLDFARHAGLITVEIGAALLPGVEPNAVAKRLARLTQDARLEKAAYIPPRCYWHPYQPLGGIAFPRRAALACFCALGQTRWQIRAAAGASTVCAAGDAAEAVFVDMNATPDHVGRKLCRFCQEHRLDGLTGLTVLVPTEAKGQKVWRAAGKHRLPLPVRCVAIDDLKEILGHA